MEYIKDFLSSQDVLLPKPTDLQPSLPDKADIKAIIFDIYGTLLISSSGDIDQAEITTTNLKRALLVSDIDIVSGEVTEDIVLQEILNLFERTIKAEHEAQKARNIPFPEIDIMETWRQVIEEATDNKWLSLNGKSNLRQMTFLFELLSNKVFPMPGMREVILELHRTKIPMGIISNAQFYTPILLNFYLVEEFKETELIHYFEPELTVFSYKHRIAKPDFSLFTQVVPKLKENYHISPEEVLFVGNDMFKDIYPAAKTGFKTALFAGDQRSLRLREEKEEVADLKPDYVITDLRQLLNLG
ncbi:MAG: HAD family hydrolase [Bacteroidota bacterium]